MLSHIKSHFQDILAKRVKFQQYNFKFQETFEISGQLGPLQDAVKLKTREATDQVDIDTWVTKRSSAVTCHYALGTDNHGVFMNQVYSKVLVHL